jgi:hypothetical protein
MRRLRAAALLLIAPTVATMAAAAPQGPTVDEVPLYKRDLAPFANKTLEQKVQELTDREEIRELIAIYAHRVAHGVSIADLFTEDGVWTMRTPATPYQEVSGMKALKEFFKDSPPGAERPMPMLHNFIISINGDEAEGINSNELRISKNGQSIIASGYYEDRYRRVDGHWKFARRDTTFFHWVPIQQGWAKPAK